MSQFPTKAYALMQHAVFNVAVAAVGAVPPPVRQPADAAENIPERCFIVDEATTADGFTAAELPSFNGFIKDGFTYHNNFRLPITRMKSFAAILDSFRTSSAKIRRIRIVTHGWHDWMEFPMFPGGRYAIGITAEQLEAFQETDEAGLRWTIRRSIDPTIFTDLSGQLVDGLRALNAASLIPLKLEAPGAVLSGDVAKFFQVLSDLYHATYGTVMATTTSATTFALLTNDQMTQLTAVLAYNEAKVGGKLVGQTLGPAAITQQDLNTIKTEILSKLPGKLGLFGLRTSLQSKVFDPAGTAHSLAAEMAASPRDKDGLMRAISGSNAWPMFANRTGEVLTGLRRFNLSTLNLISGVTIESVSDMSAKAPLDKFYGLCTDLYVLKNGGVRKNGGAELTPAETATIRDGIIAITDLLKAEVLAVGGVSATKMDQLRSTVENLDPKKSFSTGTPDPVLSVIFPEAKVALVSLNAGFRTNLDHFRTLVESTTAIDIRGCKVGGHAPFMTNFRNFLSNGAKQPTITAPEWWQSFQVGSSYVKASAAFSAYPKIDAFVNASFTRGYTVGNQAINVVFTKTDITDAFDLWKGILKFTPHFNFISGLFADSDSQRFEFVALDWRSWQVADAGPGIPVLRMEAQRIDDIGALKLGDLIDRFRIIFEVPANQGVAAPGRNTLNGLQPLVDSFKKLKASITASASPSAGEIAQFYTDLGKAVTDAAAVPGVAAPGVLLPPGAQTKANLDIYTSNVEGYFFSNLKTLLKPFFDKVLAQLNHANAEIRYYANIGLILPIKSSARPVAMELVFLMSFDQASNQNALYDKALRGWMKVQWKGTPAEVTALSATVDQLPRNIAEFARRPVVSQDDPLTVAALNPAEYCPTPDFDTRIVKLP